jgi:chromosome segregation ATPase
LHQVGTITASSDSGSSDSDSSRVDSDSSDSDSSRVDSDFNTPPIHALQTCHGTSSTAIAGSTMVEADGTLGDGQNSETGATQPSGPTPTAVEEELDLLRGQMENLDGDNDVIRDDLQAMANNVESLQLDMADMASRDNQVEDLRIEVEEVRAEQQHIIDDVATLAENNQDAIDAVRKTVGGHGEGIKALEKTVEEHDQRLAIILATLSDLTQRLAAVEKVQSLRRQR